MNKTVVTATAVLALAVVLSVAIYVRGNRYAPVNVGQGRIYRVDRQTGETVLITGALMVPISARTSPDKRSPSRDLAPAELLKLAGRLATGVSPDRLSGSVYNGNDGLTVTELQIAVTTAPARNLFAGILGPGVRQGHGVSPSKVNGQEVTRLYQADVSVPPLATGGVDIDILRDKGAEVTWRIVAAKGRAGS